MIAVMVPALPGVDVSALVQLAEEFSPRVEGGASRATGVALDASGVSRLFGGADGLARELARQAAARGLAVRVAVAATRTAATLAAQQIKSRPAVVRAGSSPDPGVWSLEPVVIPPGRERDALGPLPLAALAGIADLIGPALAKAAATAPKRRTKGQGRNYRLAPAPQITKSPDHQITRSLDRLERWGLQTLGDLARLPASELSARLGEAGLILQRAASGEDERPLVPSTPPVSFLQSLALEWPVEDLQPLAFVIARLCDALEQALARADRGAIAVTTMLRLVTSPGDHLTGRGSLPSAREDEAREYHVLSSGLRRKLAHARTLTLPAPMRDARVLRTLIMLDLESHPPGAAVDEVMIDVDVAPGRILQTGLFEPALPAPETLSTLVARLGALAGTTRIGAPALEDTHRPGAMAMKPFAPHQAPDSRLRTPGGPRAQERSLEPSVIRRFRPPRAARVRVEQQRPAHVEAADIRGGVTLAAGPWRSSGGWWHDGWDRDEWDVALDTGVVCRLSQDRTTHRWTVEGVLD